MGISASLVKGQWDLIPKCLFSLLCDDVMFSVLLVPFNGISLTLKEKYAMIFLYKDFEIKLL